MIYCVDCKHYGSVRAGGLRFCTLHGHLVREPSMDGCTFGEARAFERPSVETAVRALRCCTAVDCEACPINKEPMRCADAVDRLAKILGVEL